MILKHRVRWEPRVYTDLSKRGSGQRGSCAWTMTPGCFRHRVSLLELGREACAGGSYWQQGWGDPEVPWEHGLEAWFKKSALRARGGLSH